MHLRETGRHTKRERGSEGEVFPLLNHSPRPTTARARQANVKGQELNPGLSDVWGLMYLSHHVIPLMVHLSRKLESGVNLNLECRRSDMKCGHLNH